MDRMSFPTNNLDKQVKLWDTSSRILAINRVGQSEVSDLVYI